MATGAGQAAVAGAVGGTRADLAARLRAHALAASELLLDLDPILGEHGPQAEVDHFVEHAADALRAVAELAGALSGHAGRARPATSVEEDPEEDAASGNGRPGSWRPGARW
ncbi:MAG: hypothetical protein WAR57_10200 [Candidatus Phosphoribacter sp.]